MEQQIEEFFHDFRQELLAGSESNRIFQLEEFMETVAAELKDTGFVDDFEFCHFRARRGMRVDGFWFHDDGVLDLFIADFESREEPVSLTATEVQTIFRRVINFFSSSRRKELFRDLEETSPEYGLARQIADRKNLIRQINFFLFSERILSRRLQSLDSNLIDDIPANYHVWDISRLQRQRDSRGDKETLDIDLETLFGTGISCLPAHLGSTTYKSYLAVIPGNIISGLYEKFGARLLEQNVRCFLQARGKVNKGIRSTIISEPQMFFAYNNGITATAQDVEIRKEEEGFRITRIRNFQIVNGGQTTASLFHTQRKDNSPLDDIFVQMKLAVIDGKESETVVPRISEYANTQNRINAADFFSNHPFHIRLEEFSRRIWAPAQQGSLRETRWFYERARGQYADAQSNLTPAEKKKFKAENPKSQMFTKTDLAKFENVWDEHPKWVNLGAQKNFARYARRIGKEWITAPDHFNEYYFRRTVAHAIIFRSTEKLVSAQTWYHGGYRANIVAYSIAAVAEICRNRNKSVDFMKVWSTQTVPPVLVNALSISARFVNEIIISPPPGISNISEWCKKDACWTGIQNQIDRLENELPPDFYEGLTSPEIQKAEEKSARKTQKIDNGIEAQKRAIEIPAREWSQIMMGLSQKKILSPKEIGIMNIACQIPNKIPTEKQSLILMDILAKASEEGCLKSEIETR